MSNIIPDHPINVVSGFVDAECPATGCKWRSDRAIVLANLGEEMDVGTVYMCSRRGTE